MYDIERCCPCSEIVHMHAYVHICRYVYQHLHGTYTTLCRKHVDRLERSYISRWNHVLWAQDAQHHFQIKPNDKQNNRKRKRHLLPCSVLIAHGLF